MGVYVIKSFEVTERDLADLYLALHPEEDAVMTTALMSWAKNYFKGNINKIHEAELMY